MGTKKLLNTSSSPPISYKRHCDNSQLHNGNGNKNTCCSATATNTNKMFTKLRNYFTQIRKSTTAAAAATTSHRHNHRHHEKLTNCNSIPTHSNNSNTNSNSSSSISHSLSNSSMFNTISIIMLVLLALINTVTSNPVFVDNPSLAQFQSGRNIRHLPCIVRKSGRSGVCMFAIDCIKQNGTHLGTCIDRFYFGSCCDIKEEGFPEIADNSIDQNTISHHFTAETSTVPTSALFKLTTLSPVHHHGNLSSSSSSNTITEQEVTQILNSVTQSLSSTTLGDTPRPTTLVTNSNSEKPIKTTTTIKPGPHTTHKHSHFVIRTTAKPTKVATGSKPSHHNTTTKKKTTPASTTTSTTSTTTTTTTTTTTKKPVLTTDGKIQQDELQVEMTTQPTKLFTYQIVETTTYTPTEPTQIIDFVTTERIPNKTTRKPQTTSTTTTTTTTTDPPTTTTFKPKETSTTTTTTPKTTSKPKPQTTRKPATTKKPTTTHKRPSTKPTRKPITTTITDLKLHTNATTAQNTETSTNKPSSTHTLQTNKTTNAPRPKPKPTATIVKVPKPTTTSTTTTTTTTERPKTTTTAPQTTTESYKTEQPSTTTTTKKPTTLSTTVETTQTSTTTTTTPASTTKITKRPSTTSTTHRPGLVTWTNVDGVPVVEPNKPINSDWIPVTSEEPENTNQVEEESSTEKTTFEEMDVSVSSSISAMMNNHTVIIAPPKKPILVQKPTTSTSATTASSTITVPDTKAPTKPPTTVTTSITEKPTTAGTTHKPTSTSTLSTTEHPEVSSTTVSHQFTTEGISSTSSTTPSGLTTEDDTTENININSTTVSPVPSGLEGVDYRQVCGRRMFPEPRIVGGSNAAFGRWPWQISLRQWRTSTYLHKCGAALLNENWAITAAHCVDNVPPSDLLLRLGEYDLAEEEEPYGYQERRVQIVASHPQFDPRTFEYDLALLRFYEPVVFQPNIIPVCVPENDENFIGQTAFVTGWGRLYEDGPLPSVLQEVAVPVINNTICETMYRAAGYIEHIPHIFICAGWKKGGYDSCEGDSGGPMVLQRESDKRFQLGGVISWGIGCAEANQPGVYTRISEFRDWINQILQF